MYDFEGQLLYVGISSKCASRWENHRKEKEWWAEVWNVRLEHFETRDQAVEAELWAIREEAPRYNKHSNPHYEYPSKPIPDIPLKKFEDVYPELSKAMVDKVVAKLARQGR